ncbi:hypothetical protein [Glycomyces sp. NPDC021274]|uniref:hypothetical protein n=1 Tax=Glycomyces sp. NPDC021274 TaxID=3155120 RepID=UPI00340D5315
MRNPAGTEDEITRLVEFFTAFGIPTEHMRASPGVLLDDEWLRLAPEFVFRTKDLTAEQRDVIEKTLRVRLVP